MNIVKYIINEIGHPVLFNSSLLHCQIKTNAISAGFAIIYFDISTNKFKVKCFGGSESLNLKNDAADYKIIQTYLNDLILGLLEKNLY